MIHRVGSSSEIVPVGVSRLMGLSEAIKSNPSRMLENASNLLEAVGAVVAVDTLVPFGH